MLPWASGLCLAGCVELTAISENEPLHSEMFRTPQQKQTDTVRFDVKVRLVGQASSG